MSDNLQAYSSIVRLLNIDYFKSLGGRSVKKRNNFLFDGLKELASKSDFGNKFHQVIRVRNNEDAIGLVERASSEADTIAISSFERINFNEKFSVSQFYFDNSKFLIIFGLESLVLDGDGFELIDSNSGVFTLFASLGYLKLKSEGEYIGNIYDRFLFPDKDEEGTVRYVNLDEIIEFYEPFFVFKFVDNSTYDSLDLKRLATYISIEINKSYYSQNFTLYESLNNLVKYGHDLLDFSSMVKSLNIIDESYLLFMDLYKMLERVYAIPTAKKLKVDLKIGVDSYWDIVKRLESNTGWRKKEKEGLFSLLSLLNENQLIDMYDILKRCHGSYFEDDGVKFKRKTYDAAKQNLDEAENSEEYLRKLNKEWLMSMRECLGNYIYRTRNSYVHYREIFDSHLEPKQVLSLCQALLIAIDPIYLELS